MGYRSNVGMVIQAGDDKQKFREMLALLKVEGVLTEMEKEWNDDEWGYNDEQFAFYVEDVKWYGEYSGISLIEGIWKRFEDALPDDSSALLNAHWSGLFYRMGEDSDDIEERSMGYNPPWEALQIQRHIDMDKSALGNKTLSQT